MNGGKVYYSLNSKLNNNLIKIIQQYNIRSPKYNTPESDYYNELYYNIRSIYWNLNTSIKFDHYIRISEPNGNHFWRLNRI